MSSGEDSIKYSKQQTGPTADQSREHKSQILVSNLKTAQQKRFKPTSTQNWESGMKFSMALEEKSRKRHQFLSKIKQNTYPESVVSSLASRPGNDKMHKTFGGLSHRSKHAATTRAFYMNNNSQ